MKYYNISHFNGPRLADELVIYDTGEKTSTNAYGLEAVVAKGVITKIGSNDNIIPDGGYVISGHGKGRKLFKRNLWKGQRLSLTGKGSG